MTEEKKTPTDNDLSEGLVADARAAGFSEAEIRAMKDAEAEVAIDADERAALASKADGEPEEEEESEAEKADEEKPEAEAEAEKKDEPESKADEPERREPFVPALKTEKVEDAAKRLGEIKAERAKATKDLLDGTITAEQYADVDERLTAERETLVSAKARAELTRDFNAQMTQNLFAYERQSFLKRAIKAGEVDYSKADNVALFDRSVRVLIDDPAFKDKPLEEVEDLLAEAHAMVLSRTGKAAKAEIKADAKGEKPALKLVPKPAKDEPRTEAKTLTGLPAAAKADIEDEQLTKAKSLDGEELERYLAALPKKEHERLLRKLS